MDVKTLGVVGCGLMGSGIAEVAALAGFDVVVVKATAGSLDHAIARVVSSLDRSVAKGKLTSEARDAARARITFSADLDALAPCDLVIESTAETLASKKRILLEIEQAVSPGTIIATNTSSLPLQQLASVFKSPERFLGLHFFSPVPAMKLVEVARLGLTAQDVVAAACLVVERLGKTPILLGDEPGYIVNRLLVPYLCHAIEMLEQGVARAQDIDAAMKLGCGHPLGPLALSDLIGLDIVFAMAQTLSNELRDKRFKPPTLLRRLVLAGHLGKKAKLGLYDYRGAEPTENPDIRAGVSVPDLTAVG
ncbi:MAG: 3-hydroxyacyl-CoA dehydrogenase family protein [Polyangiaceae bacterium]